MLFEFLSSVSRYAYQTFAWAYISFSRLLYAPTALQNSASSENLYSSDKPANGDLEQELNSYIATGEEAKAITRLEEIKQHQKEHTAFSNSFYKFADQISRIIDSTGQHSQKLFNLVFEHYFDGNVLAAYTRSNDEPGVTRKILQAINNDKGKLNTLLDAILYHGERNLEAFEIISPDLRKTFETKEFEKELLRHLDTSKDSYHQSEKGQKDFAFYAAAIDKLCKSPARFLYDKFANLPSLEDGFDSAMRRFRKLYGAWTGKYLDYKPKGGRKNFLWYLWLQKTHASLNNAAKLLLIGNLYELLTAPQFPQNDEEFIFARYCIENKFRDVFWGSTDMLAKFVLYHTDDSPEALEVLRLVSSNFVNFHRKDSRCEVVALAEREAFELRKYQFLKMICSIGTNVGDLKKINDPDFRWTSDNFESFITYLRYGGVMPEDLNIRNVIHAALNENKIDISEVAHKMAPPHVSMGNDRMLIVQAATVSLIGLENADTLVALSRTCKAVHAWVHDHSVTIDEKAFVSIPREIMEIIVKYAANLPASYKPSRVYEFLSMGKAGCKQGIIRL